jgi:CheY-like chemotaxis protein
MDRETMTHIYEPFYTTKTSGKGTGMGLATVYGIVQQNDGFINVNSEPGTGTTFRVYLPHYSGTREESQGAQVIEDINGYGETILVVEDDALILEMFSSMLKMLGYQVYTAGSPGKALDLFKEHGSRIALLITDVVMPEMNGRDLQQRLQAANKDLKCLYTSGYTSNVIAHHGVLDPDVCFLQKPFSFQELGLKVRQALL